MSTRDDLAGLQHRICPASGLVDVLPDVGVTQEGEHTGLGHRVDQVELVNAGSEVRSPQEVGRKIKIAALECFDLKSKHMCFAAVNSCRLRHFG